MTEQLSKIIDFVKDLYNAYPRDHPLRLFNRLLSKTTISNQTAISKFLTIFSTFCERNKVAIMEQNESKLVDKDIIYNDKIYIKIYDKLKGADPDTKECIWKHFLAIQLVFSNDETKDNIVQAFKNLLQKNNSSNNTSSSSTTNSSTSSSIPSMDLFSNIFKTTDKYINKSATNPMEQLNGILSNPNAISEIFTDINKTITENKLTPEQLMTSMFSMLSSGLMNNNTQQLPPVTSQNEKELELQKELEKDLEEQTTKTMEKEKQS